MDEPKTVFQLFCDYYHIPYTIYKRGPKKGQVNLKPNRHQDLIVYFEARDALRKAGYEKLIDHAGYYRDESGGTVVTFSPYWLPQIEEKLPEKIGEFFVEISPYPAYGMMTQTLVMRKNDADTV